jgi:hypothetical protein
MANFIEDGASLPIASQGIALSQDGIMWDIIPTGAETSITGTFAVIGGWNGTGQGGTPGVNYPYPTKTIVTIHHGSRMYKCELQDLKGGSLFAAGYGGGTNQNLADAIQTMNTW